MPNRKERVEAQMQTNQVSANNEGKDRGASASHEPS